MITQRYATGVNNANKEVNFLSSPVVSSPLGSNANKVATPEPQQVTSKPVRQKLYAIRTANRKQRIVSDRTGNCGCKTIGRHAELNLNPLHNSVNITNVETCASVWQCPVCRSKIMQGRADELRQVEENFKADGGHTFMLTLTAPHYKGQSLRKTLGTHKDKTGITGAMARLRQQRAWKAFKQDIGYIADCRALEITTGRNGWHPHLHMIIYTHDPVNTQAVENTLLPLWSDCCEKAGLDRPNHHGVKANKGVSEYLAKWGAASELSSDTTKAAKNGNRTISELEAIMLTDPDSVQMTLKEYYSTMKGRKLLTWSGHNMRGQFLDEEKTDQELATDDRGEGEKLYNIQAHTWQQIYNTGKIGTMLSMIEKDHQNGLFAFLEAHHINPGGVSRTVKDMPLPEQIKTDLSTWSYKN